MAPDAQGEQLSCAPGRRGHRLQDAGRLRMCLSRRPLDALSLRERHHCQRDGVHREHRSLPASARCVQEHRGVVGRHRDVRRLHRGLPGLGGAEGEHQAVGCRLCCLRCCLRGRHCLSQREQRGGHVEHFPPDLPAGERGARHRLSQRQLCLHHGEPRPGQRGDCG